MLLYLEEKSAQEPDYDYTLFSFEDADQFFYALSSHPEPDFIFTDMGFDKKYVKMQTGEEVIKELRLLKFNCPIYYITDELKADINSLKEQGADGVIMEKFAHIDDTVKEIKKMLHLAQ